MIPSHRIPPRARPSRAAPPRTTPSRTAPSRAPSPRAPRRLAALAALLALLLAAVAAPASAQERHNLLAVDNELVDAAGPYYFIAHGNSVDAFARAGPLAAAMGLEVAFDDVTRTLSFSDGRTVARLRTTADVRAGLAKRADAMTVDGRPFSRDVPMAILVDGTSYVAITPVADAFGADHTWYPDDQLLAVDTAEVLRAASGVPAPRFGAHDGYVRVAVDLPAETRAEVAVGETPGGDGGTLVIRFVGSDAALVERSFDAGPLRSVQTAAVGGDAALVLRTAHAVDAEGAGFRFGRTASGTFYIDVGPGLRGAPVATLLDAPDEPVAYAPDDGPARKVVVIDAGHGGHDPGAVSSYAVEEHVVLAVALELRAILEAEGVEVVLTRDGDRFLELHQRADFASTDRNLFVSIHANSADSNSARGIETFVFGQPLDPSLIELAIKENGGGELGRARTEEILAAGDDLVRNILRENQLSYSRSFAHTVQAHLIDATGAPDRGVRENALLVLRNARIPAILVELGFLNNPQEGPRLADPAYQSRLAGALADGILDFLGSGAATARR